MLSRLSPDSSKDYRQSLRVIRRFCTIVLFFTYWAAVRHWPHPLYSLSNMLRVAFAACLAFALLRREPFADTSLNYSDEALGYIAAAALLGRRSLGTLYPPFIVGNAVSPRNLIRPHRL
jgi:hypothetical protein